MELKERNNKLERDTYHLDQNKLCLEDDLYLAREEENKLHEEVKHYDAYHLEAEQQHKTTKEKLEKYQDTITRFICREEQFNKVIIVFK